MGRPRIVEVDYYNFAAALQKAVDTGSRIDPKEEARWAQYVKDHRVKEVSAKSYAKGLYESLQPVIIDQEGEWGGYYLYSSAEEACLKWVRDDE